MNNHASRQPLQAMITRAIAGSIEKTAEDKGSSKEKVRNLVAYEKKEHGHIPTPSEEKTECHDKEAFSRVDKDYIEKLANHVDWIAGNLDKIAFPVTGVLEKAAENSGNSPAGPGKGPGVLEVSQSIGGEQSHKKDKPRGEDAAASTAGSPLSTAGLPGSKTQLENDMNHAPGGGGIQPTGKYPDKGPIVAGPTVKHAGAEAAIANALTHPAAPLALTLGTQAAGYGVGKHFGHQQAARGEEYNFGVPQALGAMMLPGGIGYQIGRHKAHGEAKAAEDTPKHASAMAQLIMRKLAGEDVAKANIDGGGTASPLAGMGQLTTTDSSQSSPSQSGDPVSGYGNQGRRLIQSNQAAINYTKGDAKGPQKTQLKEVLEEPALNSSTDSVLEQNLQNTGKAGVKIAGAREALEKVAAGGCTCVTINGECYFCRMTAKLAAVAKGMGSQKHANSMMGYGGGMGGGGGAMPPSPSPMMSTADAGAGADGCVCGGAGECKVCKLKAALAAMKAQTGGAPEGAPVEKDSTMGMGATTPGGIY